MRSGLCGQCPRVTEDAKRGPMHGRCTMDSCSCIWHDEDVKDKAAKLITEAKPRDVSLVTQIVAVPDPNSPLFAKTLAPKPPLETLLFMCEQLARQSIGLDEVAPDEALSRLHSLRQSIALLQTIDAALVTRIYLAGEHGDVRVDGLPVAKVTRGRDRKSWDARGVSRSVIDCHMTERGFEPPSDPWEVAEWLLEVLGVGYARVTPLRTMGLDPEDFCESSPGKISVQFVE